MTTSSIITGILLISIGIHTVALCTVAPSLPSNVNWFALLMIALNIGAAFWGLHTSGVNQLVYGLAAAVLNICVYFNFEKVLVWIKGLL